MTVAIWGADITHQIRPRNGVLDMPRAGPAARVLLCELFFHLLDSARHAAGVKQTNTLNRVPC
jgi:hypothetical protein